MIARQRLRVFYQSAKELTTLQVGGKTPLPHTKISFLKKTWKVSKSSGGIYELLERGIFFPSIIFCFLTRRAINKEHGKERKKVIINKLGGGNS